MGWRYADLYRLVWRSPILPLGTCTNADDDGGEGRVELFELIET